MKEKNEFNEEMVMEIWKDVKGYEGIYQVSDQGRVKSLKYGKEKILKNRPNGNGYSIVYLSINGQKKNYYVHRLVATAFIDNPNDKREVDHLNHNKNDNRACNLRWATRKENLENRTDDGVQAWKQSVIKANSKAVKCLETGKIYSSAAEAAKAIGVHRTEVSACARKQKHHKTAGKLHWEYVED